LKTVFFDITAAMKTPPKQQFSTQTDAFQPNNDLSMFFGNTSSPSSSSTVPFQNITKQNSQTHEKEVFIPPLVSVVLNLLHATQVESSNIVSVCLESLFKIALWCPLESPLRQIITEEFYEISASSFGVNFPFHDDYNNNTAIAPQQQQQLFDLYQSPYSVDPRTTLSTLDRLGLAQAAVETPFSSETISNSSSICQFSARKFGNSWHESGVCRESSLYSLALESLSVAKDPPQFQISEQEDSNPQNFQPPPSKDSIAGAFLGMDFLGDPIELPSHSLSRQNSHQSLSSSEPSSNFIVDGVELKKLFYQLDQKAVFNF
jgi:hypothetical protein